MAMRDSIKSFYLSLSAYEDGMLGYLEDPNIAPLMAKDILLGIDTGDLEVDLLSRGAHSSSKIESALQDIVDLRHSVEREVLIRNMTRQDYYLDAGSEYSDEKLRLERRKFNTLQISLGNSSSQRV